MAMLLPALLLLLQTYPGQYPPGQYPPGQYPPGQYPPGQYPSSSPIPGINMPNIKFPGRKPKDKPDDLKVNVSAVDGTLRKLEEKSLLLETAKRSVLRFRLIAKTQFQSKSGEAMRDSLMHPGDQVSVLVDPGDPETALRVVYGRAGSAAERAGAEQSIPEGTIRAPRADDLGKPHSISTPASSTTISPGDPGTASPGTSAPAASEGEATPEARTFSGESDDDILRDVRATSLTYSKGLPNFLAKQFTTRFLGVGFPSRWQQIDVVSAELAYVNGKEEYRDVQVDGFPAQRPVEQTGSWSTGEFGTTLEDLLTSVAQYTRLREERTGTRNAVVFKFIVAQPNSHWTLVSPDDRRYSAAYEGSIWIDRETRRVLRIEQRAFALPRDFPVTRAESTLNYAYINIDGKTYLMPSTSENIGCMNGSSSCTRNAIEFRNYRKFVADSKVVF